MRCYSQLLKKIMENAKVEMLELLEGKQIKCAEVGEIILKIDYTKEDYDKFLNSLDFEYHSGYGSQNLFGTVWFKDGTWADRGEYDGSEWWEVQCLPEIPTKLLA